MREAFTKNDPSGCVTRSTPRFLEQTAGDGDSDPVQVCRLNAALARDTFAHEVDFRSVRVDGDHAVVTVFVTGGSGNGSTVRIELVRTEDRWKFDYFAGIEIDRAKFDTATRDEYVQLGVREAEAECLVDRLRRIYDTNELERTFVTGETDGYNTATALCLSRASLIHFLDLVLLKTAPRDIPKVIIECISRRIARSVSTGQLRALFGAADKLEGYLERLTRAAGKACVKEANAGLLPEPAAS